jgi:DNA-binding transcriptional LysR family regulator
VDSVTSLNVFIQVVENGSLVAAGRALGISASAVGKSITRLEERARTRLFHRTSRSLRLTPEGQRFAERCRRILAEIQAAEDELAESAGAPSGLLRVSMPLANGPYHSVLADFQEAYPSIDLELDYTNRNVDLVREGFDAAIRSGALRDSTLTARSLGTFCLVLVGSPEYLARRGTPKHPRDLGRHDVLQLRLPNSGRLQPLGFVGGRGEEFPVARTPLIANNLEAIVHFAVKGHGLAYVADILVRGELAAGTLVPILTDHVGDSVPVHIVWTSGKHTPPKLRVLIDWVVSRFLSP